MPTIAVELSALPGLPGVRGPFAFTLQRSDHPNSASVVTIPIVNRGPESYAESREQEDWVAQRWTGLVPVFAGAWTVADPSNFAQLSEDLCTLAGGPCADARFLLQDVLYGPPQEPPRAPNGCSLWNPRADVDDATRAAARCRDLERYDAVLALAPDWHDAWLARARQRFGEHEDYAGAAADAQQACDLAPDSPQAWEELGSALRVAGHLDEAAAAFARAVACPGSGASPRTQLASTLMALERHGEALEHLEKALQLLGKTQPAYLGAQLQRATCLAALGRVEDAVKACQAAARAVPTSAEPWLHAAKLLWARGEQLPEALKHAAKAAKLAQTWQVEPLVVHGGLLRATGRPDEALMVLNKALERSSHDTAALAERGLARCMLEQWLPALADLDRYLAAVSWGPAHLARAKCRWYGQNDAAGALEDLGAALAATPDNDEALQLRDTCAAAL